jgi:predicted choloylglycine hydrolase
MNKFFSKYIEVSGNPRRMGQSYGEAAKDEIRNNIEVFKCAKKANPGVKKYILDNFSDIYDEITGIHEGADVPLDQIIIMNQWQSGVFMGSDNCTCMALKTDTGVAVAKNNDGSPGIKYKYIMRKSFPEKGLPMLQATYAGWLSGLDAMNAKGLANTHASVGSVFKRPEKSLDIRLASYSLMRNCEKTEEFIYGLSSLSLTGKGFNIVCGDSYGNTAVVEAAVPIIQTRELNDEFIFATNHFINEELKNSDQRDARGKTVSTYRFGYLEWRKLKAPPSSIQDIKNILSSHEPWAPCRHGGVHISETEWSMISLPAERKLLFSPGPHCKYEYQEFTI